MGFGIVHLCNDKTVKQNTKAKTKTAMKKQVKKLSLTTDKVVSLSTSSMQHVQGGSNSGVSHNCGPSYYCLAIGGRSQRC